MFEYDLVPAHSSDSAQSNDVPNRAELLELESRHRRAPVHRGANGWVQPHQLAVRFQGRDYRLTDVHGKLLKKVLL